MIVFVQYIIFFSKTSRVGGFIVCSVFGEGEERRVKSEKIKEEKNYGKQRVTEGK